MLASATGSLLDNVELINTLDASKTTWEQVNAMLTAAEETARKIEATSAGYRPCSVRAALLFFVLADLSRVDAMYQFSLDAYTELFALSISDSPRSEMLLERIRHLIDYHTYAMYKYTSRGLFERHKLLLSLQMAARVLAAANALDAAEFAFFLRGGTVLDRSTQPANPDAAWISEEAWDHVTELESQVRGRVLPCCCGKSPACGACQRTCRCAGADVPRAGELGGDVAGGLGGVVPRSRT
jgi:dynein heavy chain, axonemal